MNKPPRDTSKTGYPSMDEDEQNNASGDGSSPGPGNNTPREKHERAGKQSDFEKRDDGRSELPHG